MPAIESIKRLQTAIGELERKLARLEKNVISCCGITFSQCNAIEEIGKAQTISLNGLSERLGLDKSTMSRTVDSLVNCSLVARESDPADRRYVSLSLTAEGKAVCDNIETGKVAYYRRLYAAIPAEKRAQVLESLDELIMAIEPDKCLEEGECVAPARR